MTDDDAEKALIEELHMLREPFSYSRSLGVRAVNALESQRSRIAALEALIQKVRDDAADWEKAPRGEMAPCTGVGRYFTRLVSAAPSTVLDQMIREAKAEAWMEGGRYGFNHQPYPVYGTHNPYRNGDA